MFNINKFESELTNLFIESALITILSDLYFINDWIRFYDSDKISTSKVG